MSFPGNLVEKTAPTEDVLTVEEAKNQVGFANDDDEVRLGELVKDATHEAQNASGRQFISAVYEYYLDAFLERIVLPRPPLISIDSFQYRDEDDNLLAVPSTVYQADDKSEPAAIVRRSGQFWPTTKDEKNVIVITYTAGYGSDRAAVPARYRDAVRFLVDYYYDGAADSDLYTAAMRILWREKVPKLV